VLFARSPHCHKFLNSQFSNRSVKKLYTAIICGHPQWQYFDIRLPLQINGDRKHRTIVNMEHGKPARTEIGVVCWLEEELTWVEVLPHTGYTHQIRAHLAAINSPILNDSLYSKPAPTKIRYYTPCISRIALHAHRIAIVHPANHQLIEFSASFPPDFQKLIGNNVPIPGSLWSLKSLLPHS
jgi:23S rRNA-/tRNA-specific pseudouridylate synthase